MQARILKGDRDKKKERNWMRSSNSSQGSKSWVFRVPHLHVAKVVVVAEPVAEDTEPFSTNQNGKTETQKNVKYRTPVGKSTSTPCIEPVWII